MVKKTFSKKVLIFSIVWMFVFIIEYLLLSNYSLQNNGFTFVSCIIAFNLCLQIYTLTKIHINPLSFFSLFIVLYYVFHFGQVLMLGLFPDYSYNYVNYVEYYMKDTDILIKTILVCLGCINSFFFGGLLVNEYKIIKAYNLFNNHVIPVCNRHNGRILFYSLFPFRLYADCVSVLAALSGSYSSTFDISLVGGGVTSALATIWYISLPLYYIELNTENKRKYLFFIILYLGFGMLSGARGHAIVGLLSLFLVVLSKEQKLSTKKYLSISLWSVLILWVLDLIFDMRNVGVLNFFANLDYYINESMKSNIFLETIGTFGETIFTPYLVLEGYGYQFSPFFGEGFVKSLVSIVPDLFGYFRDINNQAVFQKVLDSKHALGGSFAGDMYYNFGDLYWVASGIIGYIYSSLSIKVSTSLRYGYYILTYKYIPLLSLSLWWIRDSIGNMVRNLVWALVLLWIIDRFFSNGREGIKKYEKSSRLSRFCGKQ